MDPDAVGGGRQLPAEGPVTLNQFRILTKLLFGARSVSQLNESTANNLPVAYQHFSPFCHNPLGSPQMSTDIQIELLAANTRWSGCWNTIQIPAMERLG